VEGIKNMCKKFGNKFSLPVKVEERVLGAFDFEKWSYAES